MKKAFSLLLLLGLITMMIVQGGVAAEAVAKAQAVSTVKQSIVSGSFKLTAVSKATDSNSLSALSFSLSSGRGFFYLKNFGTTTLSGFDMTQSLPNSTIRYCVAQAFIAGNVTTCVDGTAALLVGKGKSLPGITFLSPLAPGSSYAFSSDANGSANNTISVSVSHANITNATKNS